jgi:hypothetical protein
MANSFSYLALRIYHMTLEADPVFLGWAMGLPRIWDAFADNVSDSTLALGSQSTPHFLWWAPEC